MAAAPALIAEALGTFMLVFVVGCNVLSGNVVWGGVSIASVLMVSIYALGGVSGAHFNPAVSFALGVTKSMNGPGTPWRDVGMYMGAQVAAALAAGGLYSFLYFDNFNLEPTPGFGAWQAGLCEFLYTFMLCFVVLNTAAAERSENTPNSFYGLAIGFVIVAGAYGAGAVSGGCFNPAVAIGIDSVSVFKGFGWCLIYTGCELAGALVAALLFKVVRPQEFGSLEEKSEVSVLLSECLGTFFLVLTVGLNVLAKSQAGAYSIAAALMCMIYALGNVSGGHFNPAVTVAICIGEGLPGIGKACKYILAQLVGAISAAIVYTSIRHGESFPLGPGAGFHWSQVVVAEAIFTFLLCYVVLCVAVSERTKSKDMFALAIGGCVVAGGNAIGAISGGALNPAVAFGIACAHFEGGGAGGGLLAALAYTGAELLGAGLAAGIFAVTHAAGEAQERLPGPKCDFYDMSPGAKSDSKATV